ncbi:type II toxin-antitoxin system ParD family antitoxin [Govanella unica]|uniref:Type II toxin-antitoxin system ParD family antitoxin n=1 Tax=Govanella unica TaxID=2975056 RepID=A0A9X3TXU7_9PROT|nr:type II toxin-antitoxin system ParD family antitoxin [Govania unica]MDA5193705.1 type II toxin-antitoxin system ParD family antitoxin [Govania unica]
MNISFSEHHRHLIESLVDKGRYGSAAEVVREGLRLVEEREQALASLRTEIEKGYNSGEPRDWNPAALKTSLAG